MSSLLTRSSSSAHLKAMQTILFLKRSNLINTLYSQSFNKLELRTFVIPVIYLMSSGTKLYAIYKKTSKAHAILPTGVLSIYLKQHEQIVLPFTRNKTNKKFNQEIGRFVLSGHSIVTDFVVTFDTELQLTNRLQILRIKSSLHQDCYQNKK